MISDLLLTASNLTYTREDRLILKNLSFDLHRGEVLMVGGPNGSGKTTLLRCLAGIPEDHPNVVKKESLAQSYVGHLNALKSRLTARQNLLHQTKATLQSLADLEVVHLLDHEVRTLSAGQQRQVALARLPLSKAMLWLVDEPTTHLDNAAITHFWESLENHLATGGAAIISSHTPIPLPKVRTIDLG